jgi:hypothetical protein
MEPEKKKKRLEDEYLIIDEQEEEARAREEEEQRVYEELSIMQDDQRAELKAQMFKYISRRALIALVVCLGIFSMTSRNNPLGAGSLALAFLIIAVGILIVGAIALNKWTQVTQELRDGVVNYVEGGIALDIVGGNTYRLSVGDQTFVIPKKLFLSLSDHQFYRVYYAPRSRFVLGAEPLSS